MLSWIKVSLFTVRCSCAQQMTTTMMMITWYNQTNSPQHLYIVLSDLPLFFAALQRSPPA